MKEEIKHQIYADVFERLILHLRKRTDVQNIDLMNLSGFCRNCLSKWYLSSANEKGIQINYEDAKKVIYGMPYNEWKTKYQKEATKEQMDTWKKKSD
tara:strand:+ start:121 stop:411 length:291 start_codon:yes stop_codon:yes gene_type:complete